MNCLADMGLADVGLADVGLADTGLADTGLADMGPADTGLDGPDRNGTRRDCWLLAKSHGGVVVVPDDRKNISLCCDFTARGRKYLRIETFYPPSAT